MALAERLIKQFDYYILSIRLIYSYSLFFCLFSFQFHDDINFPSKIYESREYTNRYQFQFFICNLSQNVPLAILVFQTYRFCFDLDIKKKKVLKTIPFCCCLNCMIEA